MRGIIFDLGKKWRLLFVVGFIGLIWSPMTAFSHCDTMDGPVVKDARRAIESGKVQLVLKWMKAADENEAKRSFDDTLAARKANPAQAEMADMKFFETVVRLHRKSEGMGFSELKPAGTLPVSMMEADKALESGSTDSLLKVLNTEVAEGAKKRFDRAHEAKQHADESVEKGREYVEAYVSYIHYVERLHQNASGESHHGNDVGEHEE